MRVRLDYSTFGDDTMHLAQTALLNELARKRISVGRIVQWMLQYGRENCHSSFDAWFQDKLKKWN